MTIFNDLEEYFKEPQFRQDHPDAVKIALQSLLNNGDAPLLQKYLMRFKGPVGSRACAFQLLDAIEDGANIVSLTEYVRSEFGLGRNWVVLTDVIGGSVLMYDTASDKVFNVDFEGGLELLLQNSLQPIASSYEQFLRWFHDIKS